MHVWRSDVVGSLLRPAWLQEARGQVERGELPAVEFKRSRTAPSTRPSPCRRRPASR